jgi:hypothetical protein
LKKKNAERSALAGTLGAEGELKKGITERKAGQELCDYHLEWRYPL